MPSLTGQDASSRRMRVRLERSPGSVFKSAGLPAVAAQAAKSGGEEIGYFDQDASGFELPPDCGTYRGIRFPKNECDAGFDSSKEEFALPRPSEADFACSPAPYSRMPMVKSTDTSGRRFEILSCMRFMRVAQLVEQSRFEGRGIISALVRSSATYRIGRLAGRSSRDGASAGRW